MTTFGPIILLPRELLAAGRPDRRGDRRVVPADALLLLAPGVTVYGAGVPFVVGSEGIVGYSDHSVTVRRVGQWEPVELPRFSPLLTVSQP